MRCALLALATVAGVSLPPAIADSAPERAGGPTTRSALQTEPNIQNRIVGKWQSPKQGNVVIEFLPGGKLKVSAQQQIEFEGTYRFVSPTQLKVVLGIPGQKQEVTLTIKKLDGTEFVATSDRNNMTDTLKRIK